jgi:hypothetical protein
MTDQQLLRRAWDALDSFKQAYPENWSEEDEQVLNDLMRADLKLSGVKLKWVGLTDSEREEAVWESGKDGLTSNRYDVALAVEAKLKEKNT